MRTGQMLATVIYIYIYMYRLFAIQMVMVCSNIGFIIPALGGKEENRGSFSAGPPIDRLNVPFHRVTRSFDEYRGYDRGGEYACR